MAMILKRVEHSDKCTRGVLIYDDEIIALTLENPWKDNTKNISCIPIGTYLCEWVDSPKFGHTFEITGVKGRTHILFHPGNVEAQTRGCVLLGSMFGDLYNEPAVLNSKVTMAVFMNMLKDTESFSLNVVNA